MAAVYYVFVLLVGNSVFASPSNYSDDYEDGFRIAGGKDADPGSHPHMVAFVQGLAVKALFCGGSIIGNYHVLTAGHCTRGITIPGSPVTGVVGTDVWTSGGQEYTFYKMITHPEFQLLGLSNDIAIFFTTKDFQFNDNVKPITLNFDWIGGGELVKVAGWGSAEFGAPLESRLREVEVETVDGELCMVEGAVAARKFNAPFYRTVTPETEICTFHAAGYGTCQGDSGSALLLSSTNEQVGVVSWGFPCALGAPDVFTRVSAYAYWIRETMLS